MGKHSAGGGRQSRDNDIGSTLGGGRSGQGRRRRGDVGVPVSTPSQSPAPGARYDGGHIVGEHPDSRPHPEHREHAAWGAQDAWAAENGRGRRAGYRPDELPDPYDTGQWQTFDEPVLPAPDPYDTGRWQTVDRSGHRTADRPGPSVPDPYDTGQWQTFDEPVLPPQAFEAPAGRRIPGPRAEQETFSGQEPGMDSEIPVAPAADTGRKNGGKGRTFTGIAAAAVVTVLAVVVAGQVGGSGSAHSEAGSSDSAKRGGNDAASRSKERPTPGVAQADAPAVAVASYDQLMAQQYPLDAKLALSGQFETMPGHDPAPGRGKVVRFRVDVEKGLPLDAALFTQTVFKTLNDPRSWGHGGIKTFERVSSGPVDIVVTLASPGTTATWCAKSGLDTTVDNVSCDAASTERTMINAFRWAQGAETFGPARMHEYRQMLINHEVGHRLGRGHVGCPKAGELAPVMMQQTKFLSLDGGPTCKPNAWPFP
ncbi:DUF3152 domain-containing protein [Streptomyces sp. H39-S7]|uniref:DUF3152 domain-containing protein n=1 Tax=Streptomyces sp. H39-S7 TaxID=3004357 RepID=UPI0022AEDB1F|nr:DUF3152 domain-containing protein [Streptomyces sp. H39-S7]MCZ4120096.1 DUF3152 domain-containing protein [Streptomyces sp. H39-S7]